MTLQENIRRILKEETSLQERLNQLVLSKGIVVAANAVGGIDNLSKILNLDLDDLETQERLVENFLKYVKPNNVEVMGVEKRISPSGNIIFDVTYRNTHQQVFFYSELVNIFVHKLNNFFPFRVKGAHEPNFSPYVKKIAIDVTPYNDEE